MKFRTKFLVVCCVLIGAVSGLAGCLAKAKEKTFNKNGFIITLTETFYEKEHDTYTAYFESAKTIVTAEKVSFSMFEDSGYSSDMSLQEYAELVIAGNKITATAQEKDGLVCFVYQKTVDGSNFTYFAVVFRGSDAYWLVHFACSTANFSSQEAQFIKWAKTISV